MAEIKSFPNNQDEYIGAESVMRWLHGRTSGVFGAEGNATVTAVQGAMAVEVTDGVGWIANDNADGVVWWNSSQEETGSKLRLDVDISDAVLDRIDRVVVSWQTTNYVALPTITILKGVPASSPVAPALTNNNLLRQISLARISVPAGTVSLANSLITDERLDESVCGLVTSGVGIDTSMMQEQFDALLESIQNELSSIIAGTGFDPSPLRVTNVTVSPSAFVTFSAENDEEAKIIDAGYAVRAKIQVDGALETMFPIVTWSLPSIDTAGADILNQYAATSGGVFVYATAAPSEDIVALTVELRKAVG